MSSFKTSLQSKFDSGRADSLSYIRGLLRSLTGRPEVVSAVCSHLSLKVCVDAQNVCRNYSDVREEEIVAIPQVKDFCVEHGLDKDINTLRRVIYLFMTEYLELDADSPGVYLLAEVP